MGSLKNFVARFSNNTHAKGQDNPTFDDDEDSKKNSSITIEEIEKQYGNQKLTAQVPTEREQWARPIEFLLSCIAMSVGLGNVWRFPFVAYENGGGAFLIPYVLILVFVGKPLYYMELCLGQFSSYGSVKVWEIVPLFKGIGYGQAFAAWCVVTYYVSLMAQTVYYFFVSFQRVLPWASCSEQVNDCFDANTNISSIDISQAKSASEYYFNEYVLRVHHAGLDDGIYAPVWRLTLCLLFSWVTLFLVLVKGIQSSGKSAYFTALFPYVVLFILLIRGATLPGAATGIMYFLTPQWDKLLEPHVWFRAVGQSFFSLNVGFGTIIMFSSYNNFRHNIYRDATIISIIDTLTSFLAGFTIFAIVGHLAHDMGVEIPDVLKGGGSGIAFISYPDVLARFDVVPQLFAVLFFLMLYTLGVGSASALAGSIISIISDEFPNFSRYLITLGICSLGFFLGLFYVTPQGKFLLDLVDHYGGNFVIFILACFEVAAIQWIYGMKNFIRDIEFMLGRKTGIYWRFSWAVFIPLLLLIIFIYILVQGEELKSGSYVFPKGAHSFGLLLTAIALSFMPLFFIYYLRKAYKDDKKISLWKRFLYYFKASPKWGPREIGLRSKYHEFLQERLAKYTVSAQNYIGVEGDLVRSPYFHFCRICAEIKYYLIETFWND